MNPRDKQRIIELLRRLEAIEARVPAPEEASIVAIARNAIVDELSRLARGDGLQVYREKGRLGMLGAVVL
jgi:hypothetical protein